MITMTKYNTLGTCYISMQSRTLFEKCRNQLRYHCNFHDSWICFDCPLKIDRILYNAFSYELFLKNP